MNRRSGNVIISNNDLAAECIGCKQSIAYPPNTALKLSLWNRTMAAFIKEHRHHLKRASAKA